MLSVAIVLLVVTGLIVLTHSGLGISTDKPPEFIQSDFIDLSRIYSISKFRSLAGHDFSGNGETCRSMKHYFEPQQTVAGVSYMSAHNGLPQPPNGVDDIPIYSPVDGTITQIDSERTPIGKQVFIRPDAQPEFTIRIFHVWPNKNVHAGAFILGWGGSHVKAGEKIGVIGASQGTDISVQIGDMPWNENYVSYFAVMPDSIFAKYQARGITTRSDVIETKAYRDAHAVTCQAKDEQKFNLPAGYDTTKEDDVKLSGYVQFNYGEQQNGSGPMPGIQNPSPGIKQ